MCILHAAILVFPQRALASAGGHVGGSAGMRGAGGGYGGGGGFPPPWQLWVVAAMVLGLFWVFTSGLWRLRGAIAVRTLRRLGVFEAQWDVVHIEKRAKRVFFGVEDAWRKQNMDAARDLVSERLFGELADKLEQLRRRSRVNVMEDLKLRHAIVVGATAGLAPQDDRVSVWMCGELVDYVVSEPSGLLADGSAAGPRRLWELWHFVRADDGWVVDRIDQHAYSWKAFLQRCRVHPARVSSSAIAQAPSASD